MCGYTLNTCIQAFLFQMHLHTVSCLGVVAACCQLLVLSLFLNWSHRSAALCWFCALKNRDIFQQWWRGVVWAALDTAGLLRIHRLLLLPALCKGLPSYYYC